MTEAVNAKETLAFLVAVKEPDEFTCIAVDDHYIEATGASEELMINRPLEDIFPPLEMKYLKKEYGRAIAARKPYTYRTRTSLKGNTVYLKTTLVPVFGENQACTHLIGLSEVEENSD